MLKLLNSTETNVRVAQVNTVDIAEVLERQAEIEAAMQAANEANGYSDFVLMITDNCQTQTQKSWALWCQYGQGRSGFQLQT